jgi:hypothetical protein
MECIVVFDANNHVLGIGRGDKWLNELLSHCSDAKRVERFGGTSPMSDTE